MSHFFFLDKKKEVALRKCPKIVEPNLTTCSCGIQDVEERSKSNISVASISAPQKSASGVSDSLIPEDKAQKKSDHDRKESKYFVCLIVQISDFIKC